MPLKIKLLYTTRYVTPLKTLKGLVGYNRKAVLLAVNLGGHRLLRRHCMSKLRQYGLVILADGWAQGGTKRS